MRIPIDPVAGVSIRIWRKKDAAQVARHPRFGYRARA